MLSGVVLSRNDLAQVKKRRYRYFFAYACLVYLALVTVGPEAFVVGSLAWIPGAVLGNTLSFALAARLRRRLACPTTRRCGCIGNMEKMSVTPSRHCFLSVSLWR